MSITTKTTRAPSITLVEGYHLTAARRRAIVAIVGAGLTAARVGRITYRLTHREDGTIRIHMTERERNDYGVMKDVSSSAIIRISD